MDIPIDLAHAPEPVVLAAFPTGFVQAVLDSLAIHQEIID
jgi:hypothetical protein